MKVSKCTWLIHFHHYLFRWNTRRPLRWWRLNPTLFIQKASTSSLPGRLTRSSTTYVAKISERRRTERIRMRFRLREIISTHLLPQRLYRETYHKQKDKIHTTYDTPEVKQVKMNQQNLSDVCINNPLYTLFFISGGMLLRGSVVYESTFVCSSSLKICYKEKYYNSRGQYISMPITPQLMHCHHVNEITSEVLQ